MITVTKPVGQPTNVQLTLIAGGNLPIGKTYYVAVAGFDGAYISPNAFIGQYCFHSELSGPSAPVSVTTDAANRSIQISWTNAAGADRYGIYLSETQDDFLGLKTFETTNEGNPNIQSPYTITDLPASTYINHSCLLVNELTHNINKNLGIIKVAFTGADTHDLDDVYSAIISAGFTDYVYYDTFHFTIKGSFVFEGTDAGSFIETRKSLIFIKGVIVKDNPNYTVRFGSYEDEGGGADYALGCAIDFQNSRYSLYAGSGDNLLELYGCLITSARSLRTELTENEFYGYYYGGLNQYISKDISNFKDNLLAMGAKETQGILRDNKMYHAYFGGVAFINIWAAVAGYLHTGPTEGFYRCRFNLATGPEHVKFYHYIGDPTTYERYFYDCTFLEVSDGIIKATWVNLQAGENYADGNAAHVRTTIKLKVMNRDGIDIVGADISIRDKNDNHITLYTKDAENDDRLLGSTTSPVQTDANGEIDYYLESYLVEHEDGNSDPRVLDITEYYPFEIKITKDGYQALIGHFDIIEKAEWEMVLQKPIYYQHSISGEVSGTEVSGKVTNQTIVKGTIQQ